MTKARDLASNSTGSKPTLIDAKGDLLVGTAADTAGILSVGTDGHTLVADSSVSPQGLKWAVDPVADKVTTAGDLIYGTAADTVARLGIGTAGQVLKVNSGATAPEWGAAPAANLNWSLINAGGTNLSGSSTVTISGITGANFLFIRVSGASATTASNRMFLRINSDTGTNYFFQGAQINGDSSYTSGVIGASNVNDNTYFTIADFSNNAGSAASAGIMIFGGNSAGIKIFDSVAGALNSTGNNNRAHLHKGIWNNSATITSISLTADSNFDAGTVFVYKSA